MKAKLFILAGLLFILMTLGISGQAQDTEQTCSDEQWTGFITPLTEMVSAFANADDPLTVLLEIDTAIQTMRAACTGGTWTSEEYGTSSTVIGPITLDGTMYKATLISEKNASIRVTEMEGDCGFAALGAVSSDDTTESSAIWKFEGCVAFFEVNGYGTPWTVTLQKIK